MVLAAWTGEITAKPAGDIETTAAMVAASSALRMFLAIVTMCMSTFSTRCHSNRRSIYQRILSSRWSAKSGANGNRMH